MNKALFIFAGANGSGKSTLYETYRDVFGDIPFVNADLLLKEVTGGNDPADAKFGQELAANKIEECFANEESFCFETVFSHESKVELVRRAKRLGYTVSIYFTHLSDASINIARVKHRVEHGGHDVPEQKIIDRIPRTLANVKAALKIVDDFYLFQNDYSTGHVLVAHKRPLSTIIVNADAPAWAKEMVRIGNKTKVGRSKLRSVREKGAASTHAPHYDRCIRCDRFLRGRMRRSYGVCSICEPKINP